MLKAGFAEVDITPMPGMSGTSIREPRQEEIKTPHSTTAAVIANNKIKVAIVGLDIIAIKRPLYEAALKRLRKELGIDLLLCAASHNHFGGPVLDWGIDKEDFQKIEELSPETRALGMAENISLSPPEKRGDQELDNKYMKKVVDSIVDSVNQAYDKLEPVKLIIEKSVVEDVGYNRRIRMKNGTVVTHPGKNNPDKVDFAGPIDKDVVVLAAVNNQNNIIGTIFNYACHATVEGSGFSADWPYYARETIKKMIDKETISVFMAGCCGDITQINNMNNEPIRSAGNWAKILGQRVGFAAVDAISRGKPEEFNNLEFKQETLTLTYRDPGEKYLKEALEQANTPIERFGYTSRWWGITATLMNWQRQHYPELSCKLSCLSVGNLLICATPTETFCQTGLDVKQAAPFKHVIMSELTNDWLGYMPTADAFGPHGGGYETEFKAGSYLETTAEEKVRKKLIDMSRTMKLEKE